MLEAREVSTLAFHRKIASTSSRIDNDGHCHYQDGASPADGDGDDDDDVSSAAYQNHSSLGHHHCCCNTSYSIGLGLSYAVMALTGRDEMTHDQSDERRYQQTVVVVYSNSLPSPV